jgi:hypothetical protein
MPAKRGSRRRVGHLRESNLLARQLELDEDGHIKVAGGPRSCPSPVAKAPGRTAEINEVFADGSAERLDDGPPEIKYICGF